MSITRLDYGRATKRRPLSIVLFGLLFIVTGSAGLVYHLADFNPRHPFQPELILVSLVRILAIVGGLFLLLGHNWARWLLIAWMAFHVIISFPHPQQLIVHGLLFALLLYILFRPPASAFFQNAKTPPRVPEQSVKTEN